tara:strand:- start:5 stop:178 length:174 start_codon:yes stop_codon:yes gene_type:complete
MMQSRRYNAANETGKQFYARRKKEMEDYFASPAYKKYEKKMWEEYRRVNRPANRTET